MRFFIRYFHALGKRRLVICSIGEVVMSLGIAVFSIAAMGVDPYNGMGMSVAVLIPFLSYSLFMVILNLLLLCFQIWKKRNTIGYGTVINAFLTGYLVTFFSKVIETCFGVPTGFPVRLVLVLFSVILTSLGVAMYMGPECGVAPYDFLAIYLEQRFSLPYFPCRMLTDGFCVLVSLLCGGLIGLGTLLCALGLGPFIQFFRNRFVLPLLSAE